MPFEAITGNFQNTSVGLAKMTWNGVDVGFLKNQVKIDIDQNTLNFEVGTPLQFVGTIVSKFGLMVTAGLAELSAYNLAMAIGNSANVITIGAGVTAWPPGATSHVVTVAPLGNTGDLGVILAGGNVTTLVVKSPDGVTTTYVYKTDYDYVPGNFISPGYLIVIPGSSLATAVATNTSIWLSYNYNPGSILRVNPGASFNFETQQVVITHLRPQNGKYVRATIPAMMVSGKFSLDFSEGKYMVNQFVAHAIPQTSYVDPNGNPAPYGYIDFQQ